MNASHHCCSRSSLILPLSKVKQLIPHREPFLWLDCIHDNHVGKSASATKTIQDSAQMGKFELLEVLGQVGAVVVSQIPRSESKLIVFSAIKHVSWHRFEVSLLPKYPLTISCLANLKRMSSTTFGIVEAQASLVSPVKIPLCRAELWFSLIPKT